MTLDQKVIDDVNYCIDALAGFIGVEVVERPEIVESERETSYCDTAGKGRIGIDVDDAGKGFAYFEEAAHLLRARAAGRPGEAVDEFLGRIAEEVGRNIVDEEHSHLFSHPPRNYSDDAFFDSQIGELLRKTIEGTIQSRNVADSARNTNRIFKSCFEYVKGLSAAFKNYNQHGDLDVLLQESESHKQAHLTELIPLLPKNVIDGAQEFYKKFAMLAVGYHENLSAFARNRQNAEIVDKDDGQDEFEQRASSALGDADSAMQGMYDELEETREISLLAVDILQSYKANSQSVHETVINHFLGYTIAEDYLKSADFMQEAAALFRMPEEQIRQKYFTEDKVNAFLGKVKGALAKTQQKYAGMPATG